MSSFGPVFPIGPRTAATDLSALRRDVEMLKRRQAGGGTVANGPWFNVGEEGAAPFESPWVNIGGSKVPTRYRLNGLGETEIDLAATGGDPNTVIFYLPEGFRPDYDRDFAVSDGDGGQTDVLVTVDGGVWWTD